ncbi:MAG: DUF2513 domain-containing protein [Ghiorsea sp.]|nr:DUF2513 domain-containing protein [Ghiorsea sp.]
MKRDWDLIREILTKVEDIESNTDDVNLSNFPDDKHLAASYHAELIKGQVAKTMGPDVNNFFAISLTWEGHEFLDSIRNDTVWEKTKTIFADKGISMSIDLVKGVATKAALPILT